MPAGLHSRLSRRGRQIMEVLYRRRMASVAEILHDLPDPPSYSALRATIGTLERKGYLRHQQRGKTYVYRPTTPHGRAMQGAVRHLVATYFGDSPMQAMTAIVALHRKDLSSADLRRLEELIRRQRDKAPPT
jgi:BlaI family transcriptional regulator, penicillinase repressor